MSTKAEILKEMRQLEHSIIYTPTTEELRQKQIERLDYARKVGDGVGIAVYMSSVAQGNRYLQLKSLYEQCPAG